MDTNGMFDRDEEAIEDENNQIIDMVKDTYGDLSNKEMDLCKIITDSNIVYPIFYAIDCTFAFDIMNIIYGIKNNIHEKSKRKMVVNEDIHNRIVSFSTKIHIAFNTSTGITVKTRLDIDSVFAYGCLTYKTSSVIIDGDKFNCSNITYDEARSTYDLYEEDFNKGFFSNHSGDDYLDYYYMRSDIMLHFITMVAFPIVSIVSKKCNCNVKDIDITKIDYICEEMLKDNDNSSIIDTKVLSEVHADSIYSIIKPCICDEAHAKEKSNDSYYHAVKNAEYEGNSIIVLKML